MCCARHIRHVDHDRHIFVYLINLNRYNTQASFVHLFASRWQQVCVTPSNERIKNKCYSSQRHIGAFPPHTQTELWTQIQLAFVCESRLCIVYHPFICDEEIFSLWRTATELMIVLNENCAKLKIFNFSFWESKKKLLTNRILFFAFDVNVSRMPVDITEITFF